MSEEEMKKRIEEVQEDPDIAINTYFSKIFNVWPPKYHTFYLDYLLHPQEDDFWRPRSMKYKYDKLKVPVYFKCGWAPMGRWSAPVFNAMNFKELTAYKRCGVMEGYNGMELPYRFMKLNILARGYRYEHEYPSYILMPYIPETPGELWLQPMVDDDIVMGGSGKGGTH